MKKLADVITDYEELAVGVKCPMGKQNQCGDIDCGDCICIACQSKGGECSGFYSNHQFKTTEPARNNGRTSTKSYCCLLCENEDCQLKCRYVKFAQSLLDKGIYKKD